MTITDEVYADMDRNLENAGYFSAIGPIVSFPIITFIIAGLVWDHLLRDPRRAGPLQGDVRRRHSRRGRQHRPAALHDTAQLRARRH